MAIVNRVQAYWREHPEASLTQCERATGCSRNTARKYRPGPSTPATVSPPVKSAPQPPVGGLAPQVDPPSVTGGHEFEDVFKVPKKQKKPAKPEPSKDPPADPVNVDPPQQENQAPREFRWIL